MPVGVEHTGNSSIQPRGYHEYELPLCAAVSGNEEVLLSKSSLTFGHESATPGAYRDFGGAVSASCIRSRISECFLGEPATPNGAGDCALAYSPVSILSTGRGYSCAQTPVSLRTTNAIESSHLTRRSCSLENDDTNVPPLSGHSAPVPMLRHSRFLSAVGYDASGPVPESSATVVAGSSSSLVKGLSAGAQFHTVHLEQQLREQFVENQRLRHQVLLQDEQLVALRAALQRLQADKPMHSSPSAMHELQEDAPPKLLFQLQRARERLSQHGQQLTGSQSSPGGVASNPVAGMEDASMGASLPRASSVAATFAQSNELSPGHSLLRINTPPHSHEALPCARFTYVSAPSSDPVLVDQPQQSAMGTALPTAVLPQPQPGNDSGNSSAGAVQEGDGGTPSAPDKTAAAAGTPELHRLLAAERRRTDQAHAALLFSSRQAAWLSAQLTEAQAREAALYEELRDWRRACLENHRELTKHRRAAAAAAGGLFK